MLQYPSFEAAYEQWIFMTVTRFHSQYLKFNCEQTHEKSETNNEFIIQIAIYYYPNIL